MELTGSRARYSPLNGTIVFPPLSLFLSLPTYREISPPSSHPSRRWLGWIKKEELAAALIKALFLRDPRGGQ